MDLHDVTLREGGQMPGRDYTREQKVEAGTALARLDVQLIQVGFPVTGDADADATKTLTNSVDTPISALARARETDIDAALEAGADIVEVFLPISDVQLEHVLGAGRAEAIAMLTEVVDYAHDHGVTTHVALADAFRADVGDVRAVFESVPDVEYVTLADTVGARTPSTVRSYLQDLQEGVNLDRAGVHFHDDLGVATANVLAAYEIGVQIADVSVAALGERAGNPALEEVVVAGAAEYVESFGVREDELVPVCREVLDTLGEDVEARKAILGPEVTEHESGIHTTAMLDNPDIFEPFDPERFGCERRLLFGSGTGYTGARKLIERAGVTPTDEQIAAFADLLSERGPLDMEAAISLAKTHVDED